MPVSEMHRRLLQEPVRKAAGIHRASAGAAHIAGRSVGSVPPCRQPGRAVCPDSGIDSTRPGALCIWGWLLAHECRDTFSFQRFTLHFLFDT